MPKSKESFLLLISNNAQKVAFFKKALKEDYTLFFAVTAEAAIDTLKSTEVDCVLIDAKNSAIHPFVLCQKIRSLSSSRMMPIMLITDSLKKTYTKTALDAGFSDFIHEPLEKEELQLRLSVALSRTQVQKKMAHLLPSYIADTGKKVRKTKISLALRMRKLIKGEFFTELTKAYAISSPLCLLLIEIDDYSHLVKGNGEKIAGLLVQEVETFLRQNVRTKDLLFPQGNNGFLAILPTTSSSTGHSLAEILRKEVSEHPFSVGHTKFPVTISAGLVHYNKETEGHQPPASAFQGLVDGAMQALQLARKKGNRTVSSSPEEFIPYEISV